MLARILEGLVSMSPPASRDDPDADPRTLQRPARSEVPQDCERETREHVDDAPVDDAEPDGYGFGV